MGQGHLAVPPQGATLLHTLHERRVVLQRTRVHPRAGPIAFEVALKSFRIAFGHPRCSTALFQIEVGEQIDAPGMEPRSQGREGGGAGTGTDNEQIRRGHPDLIGDWISSDKFLPLNEVKQTSEIGYR